MTTSALAATGAQAAGAAVRYLRTLEGDSARNLHDALVASATAGTRPKSLRNWLLARGPVQIATTQFRVDPMSQEVRDAWTPPIRTPHVGARYVDFWEGQTSSSRRDFAGLITVNNTADTWVGYDHRMHALIVYRVVAA